MIMLAGGAGFIASNLYAGLVVLGRETVIVDRLGTDDKWRNLAKHPPARLIASEALDDFVASHPPLETVFYLSAASDTAVIDADLSWVVNVQTSLALWRWCGARGVQFIYTSSAAIYGDGSAGFDGDASVVVLDPLRPLNLDGWTKEVFDLRVVRMVAAGEARPPQWAGLNFFNVYASSEYHKGMALVVKTKHHETPAGRAPQLFRSEHSDIVDGGQKRDFTWVKDTVDMLLWSLDNPGANSLLNADIGQARSLLDMAHAACVPCNVECIDMPESLHGKYQSFTQETATKLCVAGHARQPTSLEGGVRYYARDYLMQSDTHR